MSKDLLDFAGSGKRPVVVSAVEISDISETFTTYGTLLPIREAILRPAANSMVKRVLFRPGQAVKKGDLIASITSEVSELKRNLDSIDVETKRLDYEVSSALARREFISRNEMKQKELEFETVKTRRKLQELENATSIHAPFSGVIGEQNVYTGQYIDNNAASTSFVKVIDRSAFRVELSLPARVARKLKEQERVEVMVDRGKTVQAVISAVSSAIDPKTGSVFAEILVSKPDPDWLSGMLAEVRLSVESAEDAQLVPLAALVREKDETFVYLVQSTPDESKGRGLASLAGLAGEDSNETVVSKVKVNVGVSNDLMAQVTPVSADEFEPMARVVVRGQSMLTDKAQVEVQELDD